MQWHVVCIDSAQEASVQVVNIPRGQLAPARVMLSFDICSVSAIQFPLARTTLGAKQPANHHTAASHGSSYRLIST